MGYNARSESAGDCRTCSAPREPRRVRHASMSTSTQPQPAHQSLDAIDQLCINTIRTLAMDAVQQANSGHPGTPMAMAPVVYTLWQQFLRFDPDDPIWPNRDRFVLSAGHASMLLYSMLHLTQVKAVDPEYEMLGKLSVTLDDIKQFPAAQQQVPGASRVPLDVGHRDHDGTSGAGRGHQCGNGAGVALDGAALQPSGLRDDQFQRLRVGRRRMHDGRRQRRSGVGGGTPEAVEPVLDLRQQPHHD